MMANMREANVPVPADRDVMAAREAFWKDAARVDAGSPAGTNAADSGAAVSAIETRGQLAATRLELATAREFQSWVQHDVADLRRLRDPAARERALDLMAQNAARPQYLSELRFEADADVLRAVQARMAADSASESADGAPGPQDTSQVTHGRA